MLIKIIYNGQESENWIALTKKLHQHLIAKKPDEVLVHIEDLYPYSPDAGAVIRMSFECFLVIAKEFVQEENRQRMELARHIDRRSPDEILGSKSLIEDYTPEYHCLLNERRRVIHKAIRHLTNTQRRRYIMHYVDGLSLQEIAYIEGVSKSTIDESIQSAQRKIKKHF